MTAPVAILAGGLGTRLHTVSGSTLPKALVPVADRPFIDHKLEELRRRGVREVVFLIGHGGDQIRRHVGTGADFGLEVTYLDDGPRLLGTGGAIKAAVPSLGPRFWVTYADSLLDVDVDRAEKEFRSTPALGMMTVLRNFDRVEPSNVLVEEDCIVAYGKDPRPARAEHIDYGMLLFDAEAFESVSDVRPFDLIEVLTALIATRRLAAFVVTEPFHDIGTPETLRETERFIRERRGR
jgi:NDP-sugar pyrophosphorylase family protein